MYSDRSAEISKTNQSNYNENKRENSHVKKVQQSRKEKTP